MNEYLFVYGTLLGGAPDPEVNRVVRSHCRDAGAASVAGRLYRFDWYPGLVPDREDPPRRVSGRLLRIQAPERCWPVLDAYEGYRPGAPDKSEFVRRRIVARREPEGEALEAWVYVYNGATGAGRPIVSWPSPGRCG
ncbi:gamma-glutamylcyclotransferase family protein [Thioalkalivibrio thiocyanodenitrificans]|uniref:gamma-glutamylcyclotransferase family protein n=1 Tax=Thioalkalivibrio thiocyanodenitrificans TaxID=243063 RepID=UPI0003623ED2|nr:gamma-glutamylcyclotransferase family protein [Thioalkalivibrio thiocyanodenitrificans]